MIACLATVIKHYAENGILNQLLLAMSASLGYLTIGLVRGFSSPGIPSMLETHKHLIPTQSEISWVCAIPPFGAFIGSLIAGPLLQSIGRKKTLLISAPLFVLGWSLIGTAVNFKMLLLARVLTGFCAGLTTPSAQVYVSECSHPEIRGVLGSLPALFMAIGVLASYVLGTFLPWNQLAFASAFFPAALFFFMLPLPESPAWLRSKGRKEEAELAAKWLRHTPKTVNVELYTVDSESGKTPEALTDTEIKEKVPVSSSKAMAKGAYSKEALLRRPVIMPFFLVVVILVLQQVSGIDTIIFYTVSIFHASKSSMNDYTATNLVGLIQVIATALSLFIIDRSGRKPLLVVSGFFMGISMGVLGWYFFVKERNYPIASEIGIVPVLSLLVFIAAFAVGYCNIPFLLMGELLPVAQRSLMSSVASAFNLGAMFIVIKTYPDIKDWIGSEGVFWIYSVLCFFSCLFVIFVLPETKGKSLDEIEEYFENKNLERKTQAAAAKAAEAAKSQSG